MTIRIRINVGLHFTFRICHLPQIIKALFALSRIYTLNLTQHNSAFEPPEGGIFAASDSCFGYGIKKLRKAIQDKLRDLFYQIVQSLAYSMSGDDQRRSPSAAHIITFLRTHFPWLWPLTRRCVSIYLSSPLQWLESSVHRSHSYYRMSELR